MFESIIKTYKSTNYNFIETANPHDPLASSFQDWVNYYKLKWSIANVLKPNSILEIGVRFGYSAVAFLEAYPSAKYVGIDLDTDFFGGVKGGINWAKKITKPFNTEFIVANTQTMKLFPGDVYDLIHVDGQQDGDGSLHDLELAIKQGKYILMDGYLWTSQNFLAANDFLLKNADLLDWYGVIPGYAGELLIKVSENYLNQTHKLETTASSSLDIRQTYTKDYFTQDCGGFEAYKKNKGKILQDPRIIAVANISGYKKSGRVLDLGCGRGELSYYFASQGFSVTSIDYSKNAIELAQKCFDGDEQLRDNVEFICNDVCSVELSGKYDLAVASDIIEHLNFTEVDRLYQKVSQSLYRNGLFVLHTFPNSWYYKYHYPYRRKIAASVGAYLPPEPRSRYELLMHINEQSPRVLKKQLSKHFEHVCVWFGEPLNPGGSLVQHFTKAEMRASPSLFAIAAHEPINYEQIKNNLHMKILPSISNEEISLIVTKHPQVVDVNSEFMIHLEIGNYSDFVLNSYGDRPVHIAYHWMNQTAEDYIIFDGERTKIIPSLNKSVQKIKYKAKVKALSEKGNYLLRVTLVQEGVRWFDTQSTNLYQDVYIEIQ
ncbi:methyltransferase, cyclopropane fatty acid synthase [Rivularia sp. PCC 7116]|uniref:methyltransferase domain-containing protein n=1 Tax=Rivularia sp. PCC 7116 TaxID=373994 RepID=UPI00029F136E|nr:methyltransferase domain-containing protein [Rivularia sp. PCC 7116]AFY58271.1 methyltransferase, cyclopropane fatty acid synthase [Rivularia sp. PCC 7116]